MKRKSDIIGGLIFLAAAVLLILGQLDIFSDINLIKILIFIIAVLAALWGLKDRNYFVFMFSLAFICIVFKHELHLEFLSFYPVAFAALFGSIGLTLIFPKNYPKTQDVKHTGPVDDEVINCSAQLGKSTKYVDSVNMTAAYITVTFGECSIYFDAAKLKTDSASINVDVSMGNVNIYVPKNWQLKNNISSFIGTVSVRGKRDNETVAYVELNGSVNLGSVTVHFI